MTSSPGKTIHTSRSQMLESGGKNFKAAIIYSKTLRERWSKWMDKDTLSRENGNIFENGNSNAHFSSTYTKTRMIQIRLSWPLHKKTWKLVNHYPIKKRKKENLNGNCRI